MHGPTTGAGLPGARLDPPGPDGRDAEATLNIYQGLWTFMTTDGEGKGGGAWLVLGADSSGSGSDPGAVVMGSRNGRNDGCGKSPG